MFTATNNAICNDKRLFHPGFKGCLRDARELGIVVGQLLER